MPADVEEPPVAEPQPAPATSPGPGKSAPSTDRDRRTKPQLLPPHGVVLHNDPYNTVGFVIQTLRKVFHYGFGKSLRLTWRAHRSGKALVWSGSKEVCELKVEQIAARGPDPASPSKSCKPLKATVEPMPG